MIQFANKNTAFCFGYDEYIYDDDIDCGIVLYREMYDWLNEHNISYELYWAHNDNLDIAAAIEFDNINDAMKFKMRWV